MKKNNDAEFSRDWSEYTSNPLMKIKLSASLVLAAAVILAPIVYIKVVKPVVLTWVRGLVRGPEAAAPSYVVDFGRQCEFPALSSDVNRLYIYHAILPAKLRGRVVAVRCVTKLFSLTHQH